jgi:hypothetical protein|tara:strand:- start:210 stop:1406 length:1197 start_codon:yes stop_codon:yes gene_type:complete
MAKNTHLEHLEDDILNLGSEGGKSAIAFLKSLGSMLTQGDKSKSINITTKWDGAPAIICGTDPATGMFFVGNKSVFAKTNPKVCVSEKGVDKFYPSGGLNQILKDCLTYLSKLDIDGVIQGDLLFTENTKSVTNVGGKRCVTFTPNTITYAIPLDTELGKRVNNSKIGIVFHTTYSGSTMEGMSAGFGVDVSPYQGHDDIAVFSSDFSDTSGVANFTPQELMKFKSAVNRADGSLKQASKFLDVMKGSDRFAFNAIFKQFFNTYIRGGSAIPSTNKVVGDFAKYYASLIDKEIDKKKTEKAKEKWTKLKDDGMKFIAANQRSIYMTVAAYKNLSTAKLMVVRQLEKVKDIGTFIKDGNGYRVTAPEGFVAIKSGRATKLVDRLEFSVANFTVDKNWDK